MLLKATTALVILPLLLLLIPLFTLRILAILPSRRRKPLPRKRGSKTHLLIVLGSGGHTAEMVAMLRHAVKGRPCSNTSTSDEKESKQGEQNAKLLDWRNYTHRTWITSSGDTFSAARAQDLEDEFRAFYSSQDASTAHEQGEKRTGGVGRDEQMGTHAITTIPRARRIHQPLYSTPLSSLRALVASIVALVTSPFGLPDLILINGPATAAIVVLATVVLRFLDVRGAQSRGKCRVVYVESWARVKRLSLSGRLLCWGGVDRVLVQWEGLEGAGGRGEYLGVLV